MTLRQIFVIAALVSFSLGNLDPVPMSYAQEAADLPIPGAMINLSPAFEPVLIKGLKIHPENPFAFDFIIDTGNTNLTASNSKKHFLQEESIKLIKYFLAAMTIPEKDLWVNLSPYEKKHMIASNLAETRMGRDMLAQDYILKQLTASLIYPEKKLGKIFWNKIYTKAQQLYGTTQIPVNTFNKVWIVADRADVFEQGNVAYVVGAHLKVMLEADYLAMHKANVSQGILRNQTQKQSDGTELPRETDVQQIGSQMVRDLILPELEKEVNTDKNFATLRQMFYSMILASWYKMVLKDSILTQIYANQSKVKIGIGQDDPQANEEIFDRYLKAYRKGVFNYIKEDINKATGQNTPRKYFSGGLEIFPGGDAAQVIYRHQPWRTGTIVGRAFDVTVLVKAKTEAGMQEDHAMMNEGDSRGDGAGALLRGERKEVYLAINELTQGNALVEVTRPEVNDIARKLKLPPSRIIEIMENTLGLWGTEAETWVGFDSKLTGGIQFIQDLRWAEFPGQKGTHIVPDQIKVRTGNLEFQLALRWQGGQFNPSGKENEDLRYSLTNQDEGVILGLTRVEKKAQQRWAFDLTPEQRGEMIDYLRRNQQYGRQDKSMNAQSLRQEAAQIIQMAKTNFLSKPDVLVIGSDIFSSTAHMIETIYQRKVVRVPTNQAALALLNGRGKAAGKIGLVLSVNAFDEQAFVQNIYQNRLLIPIIIAPSWEGDQGPVGELPPNVLFTPSRVLWNKVVSNILDGTIIDNRPEFRSAVAAVTTQLKQLPSVEGSSMAMPGGIDLDRNKMQLNTRKEEGITMHFDAAMVGRIRREGFDGLEFQIQSIVPVTDLSLLLGTTPKQHFRH